MNDWLSRLVLHVSSLISEFRLEFAQMALSKTAFLLLAKIAALYEGDNLTCIR